MQIIFDGLISLELFVLYDSFPWLTAELGGCVSKSSLYHSYVPYPAIIDDCDFSKTSPSNNSHPQIVAA